MLRYLLQRFTSEKIINYLSQTYVIRRAAQMTVSAYYRFSSHPKYEEMIKSGRMQSFFDSFKVNLKKQLEDVQREIKNSKK